MNGISVTINRSAANTSIHTTPPQVQIEIDNLSTAISRAPAIHNFVPLISIRRPAAKTQTKKSTNQEP